MNTIQQEFLERQRELLRETLKRIFEEVADLAENDDTESQLVIERDSFDELKRRYGVA